MRARQLGIITGASNPAKLPQGCIFYGSLHVDQPSFFMRTAVTPAAAQVNAVEVEEEIATTCNCYGIKVAEDHFGSVNGEDSMKIIQSGEREASSTRRSMEQERRIRFSKQSTRCGEYL